MEYRRIVVLLGAIIFLVSGFLPLLSASWLVLEESKFAASPSLFDIYSSFGQLGQVGITPIATAIPSGALVILLTIVLYPIAIVLGFAGILKSKLALVAGILGIICWIGAIMTVSSLQSFVESIPPIYGSFSVEYGYGIFVGLIGAIIMLVAYFLEKLGLK